MKIISLTSIPPRFQHLAITLRSLLNQEADLIRINIPRSYRRFPDWDGILPDAPQGVEIVRCDHDYGPATKVLPTCVDYAGTDAQILFCDDDGNFAPDWAARLFRIQARRPNEAVAAYVRSAGGYVPHPVTLLKQPEARQVPAAWDVPFRFGRLMYKVAGRHHPWRRPFFRAGYGDIFFGVGGVVVRPHFFDEIAFDVPDEAWLVDDVWLSAQLARRGIAIYCPWRHPLPLPQVHANTAALLDIECDGVGRQDLNRRAAVYCRDRFGIWAS